MIRLLQINLHHCKAASAELVLRLSTGAVDIVFVQEPWVWGGRVCGLKIPGFKLIVAEESSPRACILAKISLDVFLLSAYSDRDATVVSLELRRSSIWLASVYFPNPGPIPSEKVGNLIRDADAVGRQLVLGGDVNAHHTIWGSTDINERGESLIEFLLTTSLCICNRGSDPTFVTANRREVLDVTFATDSLFGKIDGWKVLEEHSFSDHRYIEFSILENEPTKSIPRNPRRTDWELYRTTFSGLLGSMELSEPSNQEGIDRLANQITTICNRSMKASCPDNAPRGKKKPRWWSKELQRSRNSSRKLFNKAKRTRAEEDWVAYKVELRSYKKMVRKAQSDSWERFCEGIESVSEGSRLRKILASTPCTLGYLKNPTGTWCTSSEESLNLLLNTHFPGNSTTPFEGQLCSETRMSDCAKDVINMKTLLWAISSFKPYKSPGPDGIVPAELQHVSDYIAPWLYKLFTSCVNLAYIPMKWRETKVVFIPKAGKSSHTSPKDFRPISLSSFLLKTMERMLDCYLRRTIDPGLLSSSQHAYSKGKSTETALHELVGTIDKSLSIGQYTMVAFLDIEGAFNNILPDSIVSALTSLGVSQAIISLIRNLLMSRRITAEMGASIMSRFVNRGTPQGGVISPLLWNLVLNSVLFLLATGGCKVVAYADDVAIAVRGMCPSTLRDILQWSLAVLKRWAVSCGLGINPTKTELILFTRKTKIEPIKSISLNGTVIPFSNEAKYLGVILDKKLNYMLNIEERVKKATVALYSCKKAIGKRWGFNPKIVHWIYTAVVRPILLYGILVWWPALRVASHLKRLERVQRMASLSITGALRSTPSHGLNILLHLLPLDILGKQLAKISAIRLRSTSQWKGGDYGHSEILPTESAPLRVDYATPTCLFDCHYKIVIPSREAWIDGVRTDSGSISFYTDGSKLSDQVGFGVFSQELGLKLSFRLPDHCSVYQAEVLAIKEVADWLGRNVLSTNVVNIFSDSQAAVKSMGSMFLNTITAQNCRASLNEMAKQFKIRLIWVPGHSDIPGNCRADQLARLGTTLQVPARLECVGTPLATCKLPLKLEAVNKTNIEWARIPTCRITRMVWPCLDLSRTRALLSLSRKDVSVVVSVITGHCLIGEHARKLRLPYNDFCRSCQNEDELESTEHFLCNCPALSWSRLKFLGSAFLCDLSDLSDAGISQLNAFIKSSKWFSGRD
jgi:ribonuclease HI